MVLIEDLYLIADMLSDVYQTFIKSPRILRGTQDKI